jgi:TrpR-related protein YerC/YecD
MNWNSIENKRFVEAILALENPDETKRFLRDLMTEREILDFAKRFETAELLSQKVSYLDIEKKTGFSSTTVARVSKWLNSGEGGYKTIIGKLHHHTNSL